MMGTRHFVMRVQACRRKVNQVLDYTVVFVGRVRPVQLGKFHFNNAKEAILATFVRVPSCRWAFKHLLNLIAIPIIFALGMLSLGFRGAWAAHTD